MLSEVRREAREVYASLAGRLHPRAVYVLAAVLHRAFECLFDRIITEEDQLQRLKRHVLAATGPVILLPTHKSYLVSRRQLGGRLQEGARCLEGDFPKKGSRTSLRPRFSAGLSLGLLRLPVLRHSAALHRRRRRLRVDSFGPALLATRRRLFCAAPRIHGGGSQRRRLKARSKFFRRGRRGSRRGASAAAAEDAGRPLCSRRRSQLRSAGGLH